MARPFGAGAGVLLAVAVLALTALVSPTAAQCTSNACGGKRFQNTQACGGVTLSPTCCPVGTPASSRTMSCFPTNGGLLPDGTASPLFPYGPGTGDVATFTQSGTLPSGSTTSTGGCDDCYWRWDLSAAGAGGTPLRLPFYGSSYTALWVNNNGLLSFTQGVPSWNGLTFPTSCCGPLIAAYWADVDTRVLPSGVVYSRIVTSAASLTNITAITKACFGTVKNFAAAYAIVVTWDAVGYYSQKTDILNTFQIVIVSDQAQSYIMFNYGWRAQLWAKGSSSSADWPQVGFDAGDGKNYYNAVGSQSAAMLYLFNQTNAGQPGRQCFKIDAATIGSPIVLSDNANLTNLVVNGGLYDLSPLYSRRVDSYTLGVSNGYSLSFTPTQNTTNQVTTIQGAVVGDGVASPAIVVTSTLTITVETTADDGVRTRTLTIYVTIVPSADARLTNLAIQGYTFDSGPFASGVYSYAKSLPSSVSSVTFVGTTSDPSCTVMMGAFGPFGGTFSIPNVATVPGTTRQYRFNATADDGIHYLVYTITLTIVPSDDAALASLSNNFGYPISLVTPNTTYAVTVRSSDGALSVTATANYANAKVQINGGGYTTGSRTDTVVMSTFGVTSASIQVQSEAGTTRTYTLQITRPFSANANLTSLFASTDLAYPLPLSPAFDAGIQRYTATAASWTVGVALTPTLSDASYASQTVAGAALASGSTSAVATLATDGLNGAYTTVSVRVTAQDGSVKVYNVTVYKPPVPVLTGGSGSPQGGCTTTPTPIEIRRGEYQTVRITYGGGELLQVIGSSNVTGGGAPQMWIRLNALPNVGGVLVTDFASTSSLATITTGPTGDDTSSMTVVWATAPGASYYVTFTPSATPAATAYRVTLQVCAYTAQNVSVFGTATSTVVRGGWNLFATFPTPSQTVPAILYRLQPSVALANPNDQYFYTYSKVSLNAPFPTPADAPTFFGGAVAAATNPIANSGAVYTALTTAPATGGRALFAVYAKPAGVSAPLSSYPIVLNATVPAPVIVLAQPLTGPTAGGNVLTIQGQYFEPLTNTPLTNGQVTVGGVPCTAVAYDGSGQLLCTVPAGSGVGLVIAVTLFGQSNAVPFALTYAYNPPTINSGGSGVTWAAGNAPTAGGGLVTITGTNFGLSATATVGGAPCAVQSRTPHTQLICTAPPGDGSATVVVFASGQQSSNTGTYLYDAPVLVWSACANAATTGGNPLTIAGRNFGAPTAVVAVTVGGLTCPVASWNHTFIVCSTPAGAGAAQPIAVQVDGFGPSYPPSTQLTLTYTPPVLTAISPNPVPVTTATLTVVGSGFASAAFAMSVSVLGGACTNVQNRNDTYFMCTPPARSIGTPALPFVTVAGQPSNTLSGFGYAAPVLYALTPRVINIAGADVVQISGLNMLGADTSLTLDTTVLGGGSTVLTAKNDTSLVWSSPALSGGGRGYTLNIVVTVGGLTSNALTINYTSPVLTGAVWTGLPASQPCTDGLCTATLSGTSFGLTAAGVGGSVVLSTGQSCAVTSWSNAAISCTYPAGTGQHLLRVWAGGVPSAWLSVTYRAPTIASLSPASGVSTAGGEVLQIDGANFGTAQGTSTVTLGLRTGSAACTPVSWSNYQIRCTTPAGNGTGLLVTVTVAGQTGTIATFRYASPTITAISASNGVPTAGGVLITISGTSIDQFGGAVTVNGTNCPVAPGGWTQAVPPSASTVVCTLPVGGGVSQSVVLTTLNGLASASFALSYDAPVIRAVAPAALTQVGQTLTLLGSNFGSIPANAGVTVSGIAGTCVVLFANHTAMVFTLVGTPTTSSVAITATYFGQSSAAYSPVAVAGPVLLTRSPANGPTGPAGSYNLTLTGTGFGDGVSRPTTVTVGSTACPVLGGVTAFATIVCAVPAGVDAQTVQVVVGTQSSNTLTFQYDAPTVTAVAPSANLPTAGNVWLTVLGRSFSASPVVTVGTSTCTPVQSQNHTVVVCRLPSGLGSGVVVSVRASSQSSNRDVTVAYVGPAITLINPTNGPTAGSTPLVITGTDFGPGGSSAGSVTVGGVDCPVNVASYSATSITCTLPAGAGTGLAVIVTVAGLASNAYPFAYTAPVLGTITAQSAAVTQGSFTVVIAGSNFGPAAYPGTITLSTASVTTGAVDATTCSVVPGSWMSGQVSCLMPAGAGTVQVSLTTGVTPVAGATAQTTAVLGSFTYASPTVSSVSPANGPTLGGRLVTLVGANFYTSASSSVVAVTVNGDPCPLSGSPAVSHAQITCVVPPGPGGPVSAFVSVFGQSVTAPNAYTYDPALVYAVQTTAAQGAATNALLGAQPAAPLLVLGNNFGTPAAAIAIRVNGQTCTSVTLRNHTAVQCSSIPPGVGTGLPVQVSVNGAAFTAINGLFSYAAPVITAIAPSTGCTASGNTVINCPILGAVNITLTGAYFGPIGSNPTVAVTLASGDAPCTNVDYKGVADGTTLVCTLPAGTSFNIPVRVTVGGQTSAPLLIAYAGPRLTTATLVAVGNPSYGTGSVLLPDTNGTQLLQFDGTFLSPWYPATPYPTDLKFGTPSAPGVTGSAAASAKQYTCTLVTYTNTMVQCRLPAGPVVGQGLTFVYSDGVQWSPESVDTVSFPAPVWVGGSITKPGGTPGTHLPGTSSQGEFIQFAARNVGSDASKLTVVYDVSGGTFSDPSRVCDSVSVVTPFSAATGVTQVQCRTQAQGAVDGPFVFRIRALNQWSADSTDTYSYPQSPVVYQVLGGAGSGCTNSSATNSTYDCNTVAGGTLTIRGANFGTRTADNNVLVGVNSCLVLTASATLLTCRIPAGTGQLVSVVVFANNLVSQPAPLFSYARPIVTSVSGCADQPDGSTRNCARDPNAVGGVRITITGKHFGPSGAFAFVVASQCRLPVVVSDSQLTCFLTPGTQLNGAVLVIQASGTVSSNAGVLSYAPCPVAYYQSSSTDYACTPTAPGYFADATGLLAQKPCAPGSWSPGTASGCTSCTPGNYQPSPAATGCVPCQDGAYSDQFGQSLCQACPSGAFATGPGNIACSGCPAGTSASGVAGNITVACTNCTAGYYSGSAGTNCLACPPGTYNGGAGLTACTSCPVGSYTAGQGQTQCAPADTGYFVGSTGQVVQSSCAAGSFSNVTGSSVCTQCLPGSWVHKPSANIGATVCSQCGVGTYIGVSGAADCLACAKGSFAATVGLTACVACLPGSIASDVGLTQCTNCTRGTVAAVAGLDSCASCPAGKFARDTGASVCSDCAIGAYNPSLAQSSCTQCGVGASGLGVFGPYTGQQSCVPCGAGSYQSDVGQAACVACQKGSFASAPHATRCDACLPGTMSSTDGQAGCTDCPSGRYANASATTCLACAAGKWSASRSSVCTDCAAGQYASATGSVQCTVCAVGSFANATGASVCTACDYGTMQPSTGMTACLPCTAGSYAPATSQVACAACPVGSFTNGAGASVCALCAAGTFAPVTASTVCTNCTRGSANTAPGQGACQSCDSGSFASSDATDHVCNGCAAGSAAPNTGSTVCTACAAGSYTVGPNNRQCILCGPGTFQPAGGATFCAQCLPGSVQPDAGEANCVACAQGSMQPSYGQAECIACPVGQFATGSNATACTLCAAGSFAAAVGSSTCTPCGAGTVASAPGSGGCQACAIGRYQNASLSLMTCFNCPEGQFQPNPGRTFCSACGTGSAQPNPGSASCSQCAPGSYADVAGLASCLPCPAGAYCPAASVNPQPCALGSVTTAPSQAVCLDCASGTYSNASLSTACTQCSAGSYSVASAGGPTACVQCTAGSFAPTDGAVACDACPAGSFAAAGGQSRCTQCAAGYYQPNPSRTTCIPADVGYFVAAAGAAVQQPCAAGSYSAGANATTCIACDAGAVQLSPAATQCNACVRGKFMPSKGQAVCLECVAGKFANVTGLSACYDCAQGQYSVPDAGGNGVSSCTQCDAGTFAANPGSASCAPCPPRTYADVPGVSTCSACATGRAFSGTGAVACDDCQPGAFAINTNSLLCSACAVGSYSDTPRAVTCTLCAPGRFAPTTGMSTCTPCPAGQSAFQPGAAGCSDCPVGYYSPATAQPNCTACDVGTFQANTGQSSCAPCAAGYANNAVGQQQCTQCATGQYAEVPNLSICRNCAPGTYASTPGVSVCTDCEMGRSNPAFQQTVCGQCAAGSFSNVTASTLPCTACAQGKYRSAAGFSSCLDCAKGTAVGATGATVCDVCTAGTFAADTGSTVCASCAFGTAQPINQQSSCDDCTPGRAALVIGSRTCTDCPRGSISAGPAARECTLCDPGAYQDATQQSTCKDCPVGRFQESKAGTFCVDCEAGTYGNATAMTFCWSCGEGTFQALAEKSTCDQCDVGRFTSQTNQKACQPCAAGTFLNVTGQTTCVECPPGTFQGQSGQSACVACPVGSSNPSSGQRVCQACGTGRYQDANGTAVCAECPTGRAQGGIGSTACVDCAVGRFMATTGQVECVACLSGRFANVTGLDQCVACAVGAYQVQTGQTACDACRVGKAQNSPGTTFCSDCLAGTFTADNGTVTCGPCSVGTYQPAPGQTVCRACEAGTSQPQPSQTACSQCAPNSFANVTGLAACYSCPAGSYESQFAATACALCGVGSYQREPGQTACLLCAAGTYSNVNGSTECSVCDRGSYQLLPGQTQCIACPEGAETDSEGQALCVGCAPGSFANFTGAKQCYSCERGAYQNEYAQTTCKQCREGTFTVNPRQTACALCGTGRYSDVNGTTTCTQCAKGTYQQQPGQSVCVQCEAGTFMPNPGASVCLACATGAFANVTGQTECFRCAYGTYQPSQGQTRCLSCPVGTFQVQLGAASCTSCSAGTYGNVTGAQECAPCPIGYDQQLTAQSACAQCVVGKYSDQTGQPECSLCRAGTYATVNGSTVCVACDLGRFQALRGQTACQNCSVGSFGPQTAMSGCSQCAPGSYSDRTGVQQCLACAAGSLTEVFGRNSCDACPLGTFGTAPQQSSCLACAPGSYGNATGISLCKACPAGQFQLDYGQTRCLDCREGTYAPSGAASVCLACAPGSYTPLNGSTTCVQCANATYNPLPGQTVCVDCPVGTAASAPGLVQCSDCAPGQFNNQTGQSVCARCRAGYFQAGFGATACDFCPASTFQDQTGQTACLLCGVGRYGVANASTDCIACDVGTHQPNSGASACVACERGKANRQTAQAQCADCGVGRFGNDTNAVVCFDCPTASYQALTGQTNCTACPEGTFNLLPGSPACTPCAAGGFQNTTGTTFCFECGVGEYQSDVGKTACLACPFGSFNTLPAARSCSPCNAGSAGNDTGLTACYDCGLGRYADTFGASACSQCAIGSYADVPAKTACSLCANGRFQALNGTTECDQCTFGKFAALPGATVCALCAAGSANTAYGASTCTLCDPGATTAAPGAWNCTACARGTAQSLAGQQNCSLCDPGSFASATGLQQCTACGTGKYSNSSGHTECFACQSGRFRSQAGGSTCDRCPIGSYSVGTGATICTACPIGTYANVTGLTECDQCKPGTAQPVRGRSACDQCTTGSYSLETGRTVCTSCDVGTFMARNGSYYECDACPDGTRQPNTGASVCVACGTGTANPSTRQAECASCQAGRFNNGTGMTGCAPCDRGLYQPLTGETACGPCPSGTYSPVAGLAECLSCQAGKYNTRTGQTECTNCDAGYEQPLTGRSSCSLCARPRFSNVPGEAQCSLCAAGTFGNRTGQSVCNNCPAGSHQSRYGQATCDLCPPGYSTNRAEALAECLFCPAGQANANTGSAACVVCSQLSIPSFDRRKCECVAGYYQPSYEPLSNEFLCAPCPTGAACDVPGRTWENLPAMSGWWRPTNVSLNFYRCPFPSYCVGGDAQSQTLTETSGSGCAANREGIMCSHCRSGYQSATVGAECVPCPDSAASSSSAVLLGALFIILLLLQFWFILRSGDSLMKRAIIGEKRQANRHASAQGMTGDGGGGGKKNIFGETMEDSKADRPKTGVDGEKDGADAADDDGIDSDVEADVDISLSGGAGLGQQQQAMGSPAGVSDGDDDDSGDDDGADPLKRQAADDRREARRAARKAARDRRQKLDKYLTPTFTATGPAPPKPDFTYKLKIFLGFLQIVTNLGTGLQIQWPSTFKEFVLAFDIANFQNIINQAASVECVASYSYYVQYVVIVLSPIVVALLVFLLYLFPRYAGCGPCRFQSPQAQQRSTMRFWRLTLYVIFLIYPGVSSTVLRHYICVDIDDTPYLFADLRVQCYTQTWSLFALVSIILVLLYPVGIPLFFYSLLRVNRRRLNDNHTKLQLGFLYAGYHLKVWWFELLDMLHKLVVTSLLALFPIVAQLPVGMTIVGLYTCVLLVVHPYIRVEDDQLHLFCQIEVLLFLCVGHVFASLPADAAYSAFDDAVISIAMLVIAVFFIGLCLFYAFQTAYLMVRGWWRARKLRRAKQDARDAAVAAAAANPDAVNAADGAGVELAAAQKKKKKSKSGAGDKKSARNGGGGGGGGDDDDSDTADTSSHSLSRKSKSKSKPGGGAGSGGSGDDRAGGAELAAPGAVSSAPSSPAPPLPMSP